MRESRLSRRAFLRLSGAAAGAALLSGCQNSGEPEAASESAGAAVVTVLMPGQSDADACARISAALSEMTTAKLGFGVSIEQVAPEDYEADLWQRMMRQEMPDLFFLMGEQSLSGYIYENCIAPLTKRLESHPGLYGLFTEEQWACKQVFRRIYSVPASRVSSYRMGFLARADWMRELGAAPEDITTLDELRTLLGQVHRRRPNAVPVVPDRGQVMLFPALDPLNDTFGVLTEQSGTKVVNWYATEEYRTLCTTMRQWYQDGMILRNACLRTEPATDLLEPCNGFGFFARLNRDTLDCKNRAYGGQLDAISLSRPVQNSSALADGWCLPVWESKKDEALDLLELLYTDADAFRLFVEGDGDKNHRWKNTCISAKMWDEPEKEDVLVSPASGFVFNSSDAIAKVDACTALEKEYSRAMMCGYLDPADALEPFLEGLEAAGIREIMRQKQLFLDNWLEASR